MGPVKHVEEKELRMPALDGWKPTRSTRVRKRLLAANVPCHQESLVDQARPLKFRHSLRRIGPAWKDQDLFQRRGQFSRDPLLTARPYRKRVRDW